VIEVGDIYPTKSNGDLQVTHYENAATITVRFLATGYETRAQQGDIRRGSVKDFLAPAIYGIGFMGRPVYTYVKDKTCYKTWHGMLQRCYGTNRSKSNAAYYNCTVTKEWHNFQVFAKWYYKNVIKGYQIDKDILCKGNREYGPDTCKFVSPTHNSQAARNTLGKTYALVDKNGKIHNFDNQRQFCIENLLHSGSVSDILSGKRKSHKGYRKHEPTD